MKAKKNYLVGLIALLLLGVFAVCILMILLTGANTYHRLNLKEQPAYNRRVCVQYIATQVRQAERAGSVSVEQFGDGDALILKEEINGKNYLTRIYTVGGYLMELFSADTAELTPKDGRKIMELNGLELSLNEGLLNIVCTDAQGQRTPLILDLRCGEEAAE